MASVHPSPYGPLKGEITLANGSRVLFEAPKWEFSYPVDGSNGCCTIKAEERPNRPSGVFIDGKYFAQKIRETQSQSIKINVELTEEGKRAVKEAVLSKMKPEADGDLANLLERVYVLLSQYAETFPWETELKDRANILLERIWNAMGDQYKKEPPKKQETYCFIDAICEARMDQGYSLPCVITNGEFVARCQSATIAEPTCYILFKNKKCIDVCWHPTEITGKHNIDLSKGWYPASSEEASWARAQSLSHILSEQEKKQEESTGLFDVIGKAVLQHSGSTFTANSGNIAMTYLALTNRWDITENDEHGQIFHSSRGRDFIECFAKARKIDLSKGWRIVNISGMRG